MVSQFDAIDIVNSYYPFLKQFLYSETRVLSQLNRGKKAYITILVSTIERHSQGFVKL